MPVSNTWHLRSAYGLRTRPSENFSKSCLAVCTCQRDALLCAIGPSVIVHARKVLSAVALWQVIDVDQRAALSCAWPSTTLSACQRVQNSRDRCSLSSESVALHALTLLHVGWHRLPKDSPREQEAQEQDFQETLGPAPSSQRRHAVLLHSNSVRVATSEISKAKSRLRKANQKSKAG